MSTMPNMDSRVREPAFAEARFFASPPLTRSFWDVPFKAG